MTLVSTLYVRFPRRLISQNLRLKSRWSHPQAKFAESEENEQMLSTSQAIKKLKGGPRNCQTEHSGGGARASAGRAGGGAARVAVVAVVMVMVVAAVAAVVAVVVAATPVVVLWQQRSQRHLCCSRRNQTPVSISR